MKRNPLVPPSPAARVLERHFGKRPEGLKRVPGGLANHVFEARIGREEFIVRISQHAAKLQVFMKEQWAVNTARRHRIPTPEILEVSNDFIELPYMISRKVTGRPGITVGDGRLEVLRELGHYARLINQIKTHDFGHIFDWSPNVLSRNHTWKEYLEHELNVEERMETLRRSRLLNSARLRKLQHQITLMRDWTFAPSLNHGDVRLKNAMLDEKDKIVAILDWENCMSHIAPYWELSIALHDLTMDEKHSFLEGYGLDIKRYAQMAPAIKALNLLNYAITLHHALERKDRARLEILRARLNGTFDLYSL